MTEILQKYYDEHAEHARLHESQRERATNIILSICGILIGLITFGELNLSDLPASISIIILGIYGFLFSGKHYERFRFHTSIMKEIREEIWNTKNTPERIKSLKELREIGAKKHYERFKWPKLKGSRSKNQTNAKSWIARQRNHVFWDGLHVIVILIGVILTISIIWSDCCKSHKNKAPIKVEIVK